ncbi:hypothetical protein ACCQ13_01145 [Xanthomonas sp. NCPPB 1638]|uniref:hypothetical protein n=1 Tax=Xanthomonas TaxID=338 RepID=UPI0013048E9E|nr:hypothetical protein [Xanthomonas cucurbitae]WDM75689.1 hypothetical protein K6982_01130 [Xanthomonas cucurbitae]WDM79392.1 hypothetical protein K6980_01120 [Xanthomonas cucurbitae]WDM83080.1 hypothetical protein K6979_01130 [Xanthomonas cucurbitae]
MHLADAPHNRIIDAIHRGLASAAIAIASGVQPTNNMTSAHARGAVARDVS